MQRTERNVYENQANLWFWNAKRAEENGDTIEARRCWNLYHDYMKAAGLE